MKTFFDIHFTEFINTKKVHIVSRKVDVRLVLMTFK